MKALTITDRVSVHCRWVNGPELANDGTLCGLAPGQVAYLEPVLFNRSNQTRCLACLQLLSEVMRYVEARRAGMREPLGPSQYLGMEPVPTQVTEPLKTPTDGQP